MAFIRQVNVGGTPYDIVDSANIATVEPNAIVANVYTKGEYLIWNGQLYNVIADVVVGDELEIGVNISPVSVGSELSGFKKPEILTNYTIDETRVNKNASNIYATKTGNVVNVRFWPIQFLSAGLNASFNALSDLPTNVNTSDAYIHSGGASAANIVANVYNANISSKTLNIRTFSNAVANTSYYGAIMYTTNE